jgi:hypothetical protein
MLSNNSNTMFHEDAPTRNEKLDALAKLIPELKRIIGNDEDKFDANALKLFITDIDNLSVHANRYLSGLCRSDHQGKSILLINAMLEYYNVLELDITQPNKEGRCAIDYANQAIRHHFDMFMENYTKNIYAGNRY